MRIAIVGAGVIGLSASVALARAGHQVTVLTDSRPEDTTSAVAAASFKPRMVADTAMTRRLLERSAALVAEPGGSWRRLLAARPMVHVEAAVSQWDRPWYLSAMTGVQSLTDGDPLLPVGLGVGVAYDSWLFEVPRAIQRLQAALRDAGGRIVPGHVASLDPGACRTVRAAAPDLVVNAAGAWAGDLADDEIVPVRGQVVILGPFTGMPVTSFSAEGSYLYGRADDVVVGGTADEGAWDTTPVETTTASILARAARWVPAVADQRPLGAAVGLRPWRHDGPQLEIEGGGVPVVHAYGHGGAGWTLAAATAEWVVHAVSAS